MIVLHEPQIIVLKARKVASTSFEIALSKYATESSIITPIAPMDEDIRSSLGYRGPQNYHYTEQELPFLNSTSQIKNPNDPRNSLKYYNHISALNIKTRIGSDIWNRYTKISIIRNPFEYLVSAYYFLISMNKVSSDDLSFEKWFFKNRLLCLNDEIYKIGTENIIDVMLNYDSLNKDIHALEQKFVALKGLRDVFASIKAKGGVRPSYASIDYMYSKAPSVFKIVHDAHIVDIEKYGFLLPVLE
jgi:hypothetical protein